MSVCPQEAAQLITVYTVLYDSLDSTFLLPDLGEIQWSGGSPGVGAYPFFIK